MRARRSTVRVSSAWPCRERGLPRCASERRRAVGGPARRARREQVHGALEGAESRLRCSSGPLADAGEALAVTRSRVSLGNDLALVQLALRARATARAPSELPPPTRSRCTPHLGAQQRPRPRRPRTASSTHQPATSSSRQRPCRIRQTCTSLEHTGALQCRLSPPAQMGATRRPRPPRRPTSRTNGSYSQTPCSAGDFVIGLFITLGASLFNALGLNITKLDYARSLAVPAAQRRPDYLRPFWLLGNTLYIASQVRPELTQLRTRRTQADPTSSCCPAGHRVDPRARVPAGRVRRAARLVEPHLQRPVRLSPRRHPDHGSGRRRDGRHHRRRRRRRRLLEPEDPHRPHRRRGQPVAVAPQGPLGPRRLDRLLHRARGRHGPAVVDERHRARGVHGAHHGRARRGPQRARRHDGRRRRTARRQPVRGRGLRRQGQVGARRVAPPSGPSAQGRQGLRRAVERESARHGHQAARGVPLGRLGRSPVGPDARPRQVGRQARHERHQPHRPERGQPVHEPAHVVHRHPPRRVRRRPGRRAQPRAQVGRLDPRRPTFLQRVHDLGLCNLARLPGPDKLVRPVFLVVEPVRLRR